MSLLNLLLYVDTVYVGRVIYGSREDVCLWFLQSWDGSFRCDIGRWLVILSRGDYRLLLTMSADVCDEGCDRQFRSVGWDGVDSVVGYQSSRVLLVRLLMGVFVVRRVGGIDRVATRSLRVLGCSSGCVIGVTVSSVDWFYIDSMFDVDLILCHRIGLLQRNWKNLGSSG